MLASLARRLVNSYGRAAVPARHLASALPLIAPRTARALGVRTFAQGPKGGAAGKGGKPKPAPEPVPEPEEEEFEEFEDEFGDPLAELSAPEKRRVQALKEVQAKYDEVQKDYFKELAALQSKYLEKSVPFFDERKEIVLGKKAVEKYDIADDGSQDTGITDFWLNALSNSKAGPFITERDAEVLKFLQDIRAEIIQGEDRGFKLTFHFAENPHFSNKTLEKTYLLEMEDDVVPKQFVGCKVDWKPDMDVTVEYVKKRVKAEKGAKKGEKAAPTFVTEAVPTESFFNFFDPPKVPGPADAEDMEMEELDEVQDALSNDFEMGYAIKEKVIPRAVEWFTGEIAPYDDDEMYDDEYEDEGAY